MYTAAPRIVDDGGHSFCWGLSRPGAFVRSFVLFGGPWSRHPRTTQGNTTSQLVTRLCLWVGQTVLLVFRMQQARLLAVASIAPSAVLLRLGLGLSFAAAAAPHVGHMMQGYDTHEFTRREHYRSDMNFS